MTAVRTSSRAMLAAVALVSLATLTPTLARASKTYPPVMKQDLGLEAEPDCTLCHSKKAGGAKTVTQPFGRTLVALELVDKNDQSLRNALDRAVGRDSDGDTVSDLDELVDGRDPNVRQPLADGGLLPPPPEQAPLLRTGCSASGRQGRAPGWAIGAVFGLAGHVMRRRSRRTRS